MTDLKSIIIPFLIGGTVISGVKYASSYIENPAVAAIIGGIPTGLISMYFVSDEKTLKYAHNYFFVTLLYSMYCILTQKLRKILYFSYHYVVGQFLLLLDIWQQERIIRKFNLQRYTPG